MIDSLLINFITTLDSKAEQLIIPFMPYLYPKFFDDVFGTSLH